MSLTAPDGGVPVALPILEPWPQAPWWGIGTEGTLLATALLYAPLRATRQHPWMASAEAFCWTAVDAIEKTHPYEVEAAITFLDAASDRERARRRGRAARTLVREQGLVGKQPEGYSPGEIHHPHDFAKSPGQPRPRVVLRRGGRGEPGSARAPAARRRRLADHVGDLDARDRDRVERAGDDRALKTLQGVRRRF